MRFSLQRPAWLSSLTHHGSEAPYLLKYRSSEAFIVGTVALAIFTDVFLYTCIVPIVPFALRTRSHVEPDRVQYWVSILIAVYGAALLAFSPVCGWLADQTSSRRSSLLIGLLALLGATILLNVATKIAVLILARILQGTSAAVVWVVGLALVADTVPKERLGQAIGYATFSMSIGILVGPLLGGVVFDHGGYDAVFGIAYAFVGLDVILRLLLVEKKVAARWLPEPDGAATEAIEADIAPEIAPVVAPTAVRDPEKGIVESSMPTPDPSSQSPEAPQDGISTQLTQPTSPEKRRLRTRLPPVLSLLYSRRLLAALLGALMQGALITAFDSTLTLHAANIFHWNSTGAALLFIPLLIPNLLEPVVGWITDRFGPRLPTALGFLFATVPFVCLRFVQENTMHDKVLLCALLAIIGLCLASTFPPIMVEIFTVVEEKERRMAERGERGFGEKGAYAQGYGLYNMAFAGGCLVGPLLAGFLVEQHGWSTMGWVVGMLSGVTAVPTFLWVGGVIGGKER